MPIVPRRQNIDSMSDDDVEESAPDYVTLKLSLKALIGCLQMFAMSGSNNLLEKSKSSGNNVGGIASNEIVVSTTCRFQYKGPGHPLLVYFKEGKNISTKCELKTYFREENLWQNDNDNEDGDNELMLMTDKITQQIIINGSVVEDAIKELDSMKTNAVTIRASSVHPHFSIISHSELGTSQYEFPNDLTVIDVFKLWVEGSDGRMNEVTDGRFMVSNDYQFTFINNACEAIQLASKVSIRSDTSGLLSLQCLCAADGGRQSLIDFRILPID